MAKKIEKPSSANINKKKVNSKIGLFLRKDADINSAYLTVMPHGSTVEVLDEHIGVNNGYSWVKCSYKDATKKDKYTGYAVSTYLS